MNNCINSREVSPIIDIAIATLPVLASVSITLTHEVFGAVPLVIGSITVQFCTVLLRDATVLLKHVH